MKFSLLLIGLSLFFNLSAGASPVVVPMAIDNVPVGSIVIKERQRMLYLKVGPGQALAYQVATPKTGRWSGMTRIQEMRRRPSWSPPAVVKRANPSLPDVIEGGAYNNPMGEAALLLELPEIAIHGTSAGMRGSIGTAASFGCIRMRNKDVLDLYARVSVGALVYMMQ